MKNLTTDRLAQLALNDTKAKTATKAKSYIYQKAHSILKATPQSLAQAILAIKKNRETGFLAI